MLLACFELQLADLEENSHKVETTAPLQPSRLPDGTAFAHTLYSALRSLVVFQNELLVASKEYALVRDRSAIRRWPAAGPFTDIGENDTPAPQGSEFDPYCASGSRPGHLTRARRLDSRRFHPEIDQVP